jgi:alcohol dehydrogenase class IV
MGLETRGMTEPQRAKLIIEELAKMRQRLGIADTLRSRGVTGSDIPELAKHAAKDACLFTNPRQASIGDIKVIYGEAL